jgi:hypothetical protein
MIALALAASIVAMNSDAGPPPPRAAFQPSGAVARAEVRIRIISGSTVRLGQSATDSEAMLRGATVRIEGEDRVARLIEFP